MSLSIDLAALLRRRKPERRLTQLAVRPRAELVAAANVTGPGRPALLVDTNVYINNVAGRLPAAAQSLVDRGLLYHCTVCLAELATGVANADPTRPSWPGIRDYYVELFDNIPIGRTLAPDDDIWADAGLIAGTLSRTQGYQPHQRKEALNDALIYLTATKAGLPVLTENRDDFDLIQQLAPQGQFIHY